MIGTSTNGYEEPCDEAIQRGDMVAIEWERKPKRGKLTNTSCCTKCETKEFDSIIESDGGKDVIIDILYFGARCGTMFGCERGMFDEEGI